MSTNFFSENRAVYDNVEKNGGTREAGLARSVITTLTELPWSTVNVLANCYPVTTSTTQVIHIPYGRIAEYVLLLRNTGH
jgi:hypothetical protein